MSKTVIQIENLSKLYRLGVWGTGTLKEDIIKKFRASTKNKNTIELGSENKLDTIDEDHVWALRDINLEVQQGEVLGIIGKNGAGKSTLLKILSQITGPTSGSIKMKGRVASLLEVGTGMHQELTGRENIFLNGAILGMKKWEVKNKFEEIVDFAGIAKYVDTPIKRYSSGMRVRLGFAIAAFLEPEILIIDEVLAVGDAEFQRKAIGKMQDVSKGEGRTVLFVSHNMNSIRKLCTRGVLLSQGKLVFNSDVSRCIEEYLRSDNKIDIRKGFKFDSDFIKIEKTTIEQNQKEVFENVERSIDLAIKINYTLKESKENLRIKIQLHNNDEIVFHTDDISEKDANIKRNAGSYVSALNIPKYFLNSINYSVFIGIDIPGETIIMDYIKIRNFKVIDTSNKYKYHYNWPGIIRPELQWSQQEV